MELPNWAAPGQNWAGNHKYKAERVFSAKTVREIQAIVAEFPRVKAVGSRHCFNDIADSPVAQISTEHLDNIEIDEAAMTVTVGSGVSYGRLCPELHSRGFALHNLASLPHISVAGACATATHGSGVKNGNLASAVSAIEFISGKCDLVRLTRTENPESFFGAVVNLGALGIVTSLTLDIEPTYEVRQDVFQNLPLEQLVESFSEIMSTGYSVSLFTDWRDSLVSQIWIKRKIDETVENLPGELFGAAAATEHLHPLKGVTTENRTEQMGIPGCWFDRLPHFKMGYTPSHGQELQTEYFVPAADAVDAILAVESMRDEIGPLLRVSEIRTIAADKHWLSPCFGQDCAAIHFTWWPDNEAVARLLPRIESTLRPFAARPHWGKLFMTPREELWALFEKMPDFAALVESFDPAGKFRNDYLDRILPANV